RMDAEAGAVDVVLEPVGGIAAVVEVVIRGIDLEIADALEDAYDVEDRHRRELELQAVGAVLRGVVAGGEVGAREEPRQRDADQIVAELPVEQRALEEDRLGVVAVDVTDFTDCERVEHAEVGRADRGTVQPLEARREAGRQAAHLDVFVRPRIELAAVAADAGTRRVAAEAAVVCPLVLVEARLHGPGPRRTCWVWRTGRDRSPCPARCRRSPRRAPW